MTPFNIGSPYGPIDSIGHAKATNPCVSAVRRAPMAHGATDSHAPVPTYRFLRDVYWLACQEEALVLTNRADQMVTLNGEKPPVRRG